MFNHAKSLFSFVKVKLVKTRESITRSVTQVFVDTVATNVNRKKVVIDDNTVNELQEALILSDVSFNSSERIIKKFKDGLKNQETEELLDLGQKLRKESDLKIIKNHKHGITAAVREFLSLPSSDENSRR